MRKLALTEVESLNLIGATSEGHREREFSPEPEPSFCALPHVLESEPNLEFLKGLV